MNEAHEKVYYRNKKIPEWWEWYLPEEKNPYQENDTLTLEKGCLVDYWHIHSSNKHPNHRGVEACNFVHEMIYRKFGGAFLTSSYYLGGGRRGEHSYYEPNHLVYDNSYIGEDGKIHIKNAKQYYEDVIIFVKNVLQEISKNHYQSGNSYNASEFFPFATDAEIEKSRIEGEKRREKTKKLQEKMEQYVSEDEFLVETFEFKSVCFNAHYNVEDGWYNENFNFEKIETNIPLEKGYIIIIVNMPSLYYSDSKKKNIDLATKIMNISYCLYLSSRDNKETSKVTVAIPKEKVSDFVKQKINDACNEAMKKYNKEHIEIIENKNVNPIYRYYPHNIFLDNRIGKLNLLYKENAGRNSWRMQWY